jgi:hypothetical protein
MGCRSTVGRLTLDQLIGVRIPAPQFTNWLVEAGEALLEK